MTYQPKVYVNYTIPGFILYRVVMQMEYQDNFGNKIAFKSEIIDISIPRIGSAEVYMSQDGIITNFTRLNSINEQKVNGILLPGWGYHFYENLNLLQEIELGISGSSQKKQKRIERGNEALNRLVRANGNKGHERVIFETTILEDISNPNSFILGFQGALLSNIDSFVSVQ